MAIKKTKISCVIQDGIAYHVNLALRDIYTPNKLLAIIDESTDIFVSQISAMVIRCFDTCREDVADA